MSSFPTFQNLRKQIDFQGKIIITTCGTVCLAEGIIDDTCFVIIFSRNPSNSQDVSDLKVHYYEERIARMNEAHGEHVGELEQRIKDLKARSKASEVHHREELELEKEKWKKKMTEMTEDHEEMVQTLKTEYTVALDRIKEAQQTAESNDELAANAARYMHIGRSYLWIHICSEN